MRPARRDEPSPNELRQRGELDTLRREVTRLRKRLAEAAAAAAIDADILPTDPTLALVPGGAVDAGDRPAAGVPPLALVPGVAGGAEPGDGDVDELSRLRKDVEVLGAAKQRLSRLYFSQLEENKKRASKLHLILEDISQINSELHLDAVLDRVAVTVRDSLGFRRVLIRLRETGTSRLRARAFAGLDDAARLQLESRDIEVDDFLSWLREEFRVSQSFFISHVHPLSQALPEGVTPDLGDRRDWEWHSEDVLFVPLFNRAQELVAYFSVDDPEDRLVPSRESVELLEIYGHHAVVAIENARLYRELERRSRDLEEAQRLQAEMQQLKESFLSTVSHELRTPVTAIRAFVDTMLGANYGEITHQQAKHFLSIINDEAQRLSRLIESLLDLNRAESGPAPAETQSVDLRDIISETMQMLEPLAQVGRITLKLDGAQADTRLDASRDQLRQLALHLGNNAIKFTPPGGSVTFVLTGDEAGVGLDVVDTGIGIPVESLERIFERFYQVDSSLVRRYGGTGLGLSICKSIVEHHGGRVHAESAPDHGSRFVVRLPRNNRPRVVVQPGPTPEAAPADILRLAIETVAEIMRARVVSLLCPEPDGALVIRAALGLEDEVVRRVRIEPGTGVAGWVAVNRRPVCVSGAEENPEVAGTGRSLYESRTFLSVPIEHGDRLLGVLNVTDPASHHPFDAEDCHLLLQLAQRIAAAWQQALDVQERQAGVADTANTLRQLLGHLERGRRVAPNRVSLARALARGLELPEDQVAVIGFAANVHDIGMRAVGEQVVNAPGALTEDGRRQVEAHPDMGADILGPVEVSDHVQELVRAHHEWWNGSGYPRGLAGDAIPLGGRILAVVDAYESMTNARPHRPAVSREQAVAEIERSSGVQFDPQVVRALPAALEQMDRQQRSQAKPNDPTIEETGR